MNGISIVVCYRNREEHLSKFVPHIRNVFKDINHEIIIVEQDDDDKFRRGQLLNDGVRYAKYDRVALHDVDYLPESADAYFSDCQVTLPVKRVIFTENDGVTELDLDKVPTGYRHFRDSVDDNFFGGVIVFKKSIFKYINGYNTLYQGWGKEDEDLRERIKFNNINIERTDGTFKALKHNDSYPGLDDDHFKYNQNVFNNVQKCFGFGYNTTDSNRIVDNVEKDRWGVDVYVKAKNWLCVPDLTLEAFLNVNNLNVFYEDTTEHHKRIWNSFKALVNSHNMLKQHRDWVVKNNWGYGNRAFHWMWNILVHDAPDNFKFLEIGVFKGQTISLVSLLNKLYKKDGLVYGISPLDKSGDKYATHPDLNYEELIQQIYYTFGLDASDLVLIEGYSDDKKIIDLSKNEGPFDLLYIDGCHDYDVVVSDITNYADMLKMGGYMVLDDASNYLNIPDGLIRLDWRGLEDVSNAVRDTVEKDSRFIEYFAVGHNRVFKKIGE